MHPFPCWCLGDIFSPTKRFYVSLRLIPSRSSLSLLPHNKLSWFPLDWRISVHPKRHRDLFWTWTRLEKKRQKLSIVSMGRFFKNYLKHGSSAREREGGGQWYWIESFSFVWLTFWRWRLGMAPIPNALSIWEKRGKEGVVSQSIDVNACIPLFTFDGGGCQDMERLLLLLARRSYGVLERTRRACCRLPSSTGDKHWKGEREGSLWKIQNKTLKSLPPESHGVSLAGL